jgi:hypothetical protein
MKCMISVDNAHIKRVTNEKASELYHEGWRYIPKSDWKERVRDIDKEVHESPVGAGFAHKDTKANKTSRASKRLKRKSNK